MLKIKTGNIRCDICDKADSCEHRVYSWMAERGNTKLKLTRTI